MQARAANLFSLHFNISVNLVVFYRDSMLHEQRSLWHRLNNEIN